MDDAIEIYNLKTRIAELERKLEEKDELIRFDSNRHFNKYAELERKNAKQLDDKDAQLKIAIEALNDARDDNLTSNQATEALKQMGVG